MSRVNKTKGNLLDIWNDIDGAYERVKRSLEKLSSMSSLPDDLLSELERFDISAISSIKEHVEILLDEVALNI